MRVVRVLLWATIALFATTIVVRALGTNGATAQGKAKGIAPMLGP